MSAGGPTGNLSEEDDLLAAELALGALDGTEQATAEARTRAEPAFAAAVARWHGRFAVLEPEGSAPPLWPQVAARLPANDDLRGLSVRRWRTAALGLGAAACALMALVILPFLRAPAPETVLVATLGGAGQTATVAIGIDPVRGRLVVQPSALHEMLAGRAAELWVVPADGRPRSLGVIDAAASRALAAELGVRNALSPDATLAISFEPPGGSPTGQPTGPIVLSGRVTPL